MYSVYEIALTRHLLSKMAGTAKKTDLGLLEEDDEFEEFPAEGKSFEFIIFVKKCSVGFLNINKHVFTINFSLEFYHPVFAQGASQ